MTTKALLKTPVSGTRISMKTAGAPRRRGRPRQPEPFLQVPHPLDPRRILCPGASRIASWAGVSLTTARRWCKAPHAVPVAVRRLLALYTHGFPPIPPDAWGDKSAAGWLQFSFYFETDPSWSRGKAGQWLLAMPGQRPANWCQVHALFVTLPAYGRLLEDWRQHVERTRAAEAEARRWRDLVACGH